MATEQSTFSTASVLSSNVSKAKPCENLINYNGNLYVCFERINFLLMVAFLFFIFFIIFAVLGNLSVILAILKEKRLRTSPSIYLILSLAVTDLIVGGLTVPLRVLNEVLDYGTWHYGAILCDIRVVIDKICIYSSMLHVLIIAIDRYRTLSDLNYSLTRSSRQITFMVSCVWMISILLASAPVFGWRDKNFRERIKNGSCFVNTLFSLNFTVWLIIFVIPCTFTAILYFKIYIIIKNQNLSYNKSHGQQAINSLSVPSQNQSNNIQTVSSTVRMKNVSKIEQFEILEPNKNVKNERKNSEKKASKTLILITISIIICWSPFFTLYTISSVFKLKTGNTYNIWFKMSIWLGYSNSICNMVLYAFYNPIYRTGIKSLFKFKF